MITECLFCKQGFLKDDFPHKIVALHYSTAVLNKNQFYYGRALVIFNKHVEIDNLFELPENVVKEFWAEAVKVAQAVQKATKADRMNYSLLCNREHHLHWHLFPRYRSEPNFTNSPWSLEGNKEISEEEMQKLIKQIQEVI